MLRPAIVVFCGNPPRDEQQKNLPPRFLSRLHQSLLRRLRTLDADVYVARHDDHRFHVGDKSWPIASLGTQIDVALRHCFDRGHQRVVIVAGDAPVDESIVRRALDATSPVIAASSDGGFALAGFNAPPPIDWDAVVADRARAAQTLREYVDVVDLPRVDDIDTLEDARRLMSDVPRCGYAAFTPAAPPCALAPSRPAPRAPPSF